MRGQPPLQLLLVILVFAALGWPVVRLTRPAAASGELPAPTAASPGTTAETGLTVTATFVPAPEEFHLQSLGRDLLTGGGSQQTEWTGTWKTALPPEGADLALRVRWPAVKSPAAARVVVRFADDTRPPLERVFWSSRGGLTELVTIPGVTP